MQWPGSESGFDFEQKHSSLVQLICRKGVQVQIVTWKCSLG